MARRYRCLARRVAAIDALAGNLHALAGAGRRRFEQFNRDLGEASESTGRAQGELLAVAGAALVLAVAGVVWAGAALATRATGKRHRWIPISQQIALSALPLK